jgi:hypothetical protein
MKRLKSFDLIIINKNMRSDKYNFINIFLYKYVYMINMNFILKKYEFYL